MKIPFLRRQRRSFSEPCYYLALPFPSANAAAAFSNQLRREWPGWETQHARLFKSGERIPLCRTED